MEDREKTPRELHGVSFLLWIHQLKFHRKISSLVAQLGDDQHGSLWESEMAMVPKGKMLINECFIASHCDFSVFNICHMIILSFLSFLIILIISVITAILD